MAKELEDDLETLYDGIDRSNVNQNASTHVAPLPYPLNMVRR